MNDVIWKDVLGYEGLYQISNTGDVRAYRRSGSRGDVLKQVIVRGKPQVFLSKNNERKAYLVEQLQGKAS